VAGLPDGEGFGRLSAAAQVIPCTLKVSNAISSARLCRQLAAVGPAVAKSGFPMKYGKAVLAVNADTLTGTLN